jgi:hypothetical protein
MKTITIDGIDYALTPLNVKSEIKAEQKTIKLIAEYEFEVCNTERNADCFSDADKFTRELGTPWRLPTIPEAREISKSRHKINSNEVIWIANHYFSWFDLKTMKGVRSIPTDAKVVVLAVRTNY